MRASVVASSVLVLLLVAPAAAQRGTEDESADLVREGRGLLERKRYGSYGVAHLLGASRWRVDALRVQAQSRCAETGGNDE